MQMLCDGACRPLQHIISSTRDGTSGTFSAIAIVIENRKLEVHKKNTREEKERLEIQLADQTCQLFKFTFWGQVAVQASSKFSPGSVILLDQFIAKSRFTNVVEGLCGENTTTHLLYNKFGVTFEEERFPILFKSLIELVKFSHSRYRLFYTNYIQGNNSSQGNNNSNLLSQLLNDSQQEQTGISVGSPSQADETAKCSIQQETEQLLSPQLFSAGVDTNSVPFRNVNATSVPIKVLEDYKVFSSSNENISLRVDKDLRVKIRDVLTQDFQALCQLSSNQLNETVDQRRWCSNWISSRWKVVDARTNVQICLCFQSKNEAYNRAVTIFDLKDGDIIDMLAVSTSPTLVQATHLLILREGGRSLTNCHNRLLLGNQKSSSFVQELLVSDDSTFYRLSYGKRHKRSPSTPLKRFKDTENFNINVNKKKLYTLHNCRLMGIFFPLHRAQHTLTRPNVTPTTAHHCSNLQCDAFLWQLLDLRLMLAHTPQRRGLSSEHTDTCLSLSYPSMKYQRLFFSLRRTCSNKSNTLMKLPVEDSAMTSLLGGIPASLLIEALLRAPSCFSSCCSTCVPFLRHILREHGMRCPEKQYTKTADGCAAAQEDEALQHIMHSVQRIFQSLIRSPVLAHSRLGVGEGAPNAANIRSAATSKASEEALFCGKIEYEDNRAKRIVSSDEEQCLHMCGSGESFTVQVSASMTSTNPSFIATAAQALPCSPGSLKEEGGKIYEEIDCTDVMSLLQSFPSRVCFQSFL